MRILGLVATLMFINCCAAQTNRTSVWLLANSQIVTTRSRTPRSCFISDGTGATASSSITLLTTSNLAITGTFAQLGSGVAEIWVDSNSVLYTLRIQFILNSTYSLTLALPNSGSITGSNFLSVANLFTPASEIYWQTTISSTSYPYSMTYNSNTVLTPTGKTWFSVQDIQDISNTAYPTYSSGIVITDYISSSTIAISLWTDNSYYSATSNGVYNGLYQLGVRTQTNKIWSTSSVLANAANCVASGGRRKRSFDHLINKRAVSSCASATSIDPSMTSSVLASACNAVSSVATGVSTETSTSSDLQDAFNKGVTAMNTLFRIDSAVFTSEAGQRNTAWILGDEQIMSVTKKYQACAQITPVITNLLTTTNNYVTITTNTDTPIGNNYAISGLIITFKNLDGTVYSWNLYSYETLTASFGYNGPSTILSSSGSTWLTIKPINTIYYSSFIYTSSVLVQDYFSNTSIAIIQFTDNMMATMKTYQLIVRTSSSQLALASGILVNGCNSRASVGRKKRAATTCASMTSGTRDSSLNSLMFNTVCTTATASYWNFGYAIASVVSAMNSLKAADDTVFSVQNFKTDKTVWLLGDELILSATKSYQACTRIAATPRVLLLTAKSYLRITANSDAQVGKTGNFVLTGLTIKFTNSDATTYTYILEITDASSILPGTFGYSGPSIVNTKSSSTWLTIKSLYSTRYSSTMFTSAQQITDYNSNSTITIIQFTDGSIKSFEIIVQTTSSQLVSASGTLISGCTTRAAGRKKRADSMCSSLSGSSDSELNSACETAATTDSNLAYAIASAATAMNKK